MNRLFNSVIGEVDSSPFAPRSKMIGEELIGSLVGSGVSAIGSLLGLSSSKSANQQNIEMQREVNKQNYQMFKENQAWQEDMWNKQNEYNLPTNVVQRLKDAACMVGVTTEPTAPAGVAEPLPKTADGLIPASFKR